MVILTIMVMVMVMVMVMITRLRYISGCVDEATFDECFESLFGLPPVLPSKGSNTT